MDFPLSFLETVQNSESKHTQAKGVSISVFYFHNWVGAISCLTPLSKEQNFGEGQTQQQA